MFDLIGDIQGHGDELWQLLELSGHERIDGVYRHDQRTAMFLDDFIDRGPQIRQVFETVPPMVERQYACAVMGNHEWNALASHCEDPVTPGEYLCRHSEKNRRQHCQTLAQLTLSELQSYLEWFRTLPLWLT